MKPSEARADGSVELRKISLALIAPFVPELPLYDAEAGTVTAQLELAADSSDRIAIEGGLRVRELALFSERIAAAPDHESRWAASLLLDQIFGREQESTRTMAVLHLRDGHTLQEVAEVMGMSVSGVRKRLRTLKAHVAELEAL